MLASLEARTFPEGRTELQGERLYVSSTPHARTRPAQEAPLEAHWAYIDVQAILEGTDTMGWAPLASCRTESKPYDSAKDILFFQDEPASMITVRPGQVIVFFPEDAHAPLIGNGDQVRKLIVKVKV